MVNAADPAPLLTAFHESIREPNAAFISPKRLSERLDVNLTTLSRMMSVHRNALRNPRSEALQAKMREIARIVGRVEVMLGDRDKAIFWFKNQPLQDYGGKTPDELVRDGHVEAVLQYLDDMSAGALG